MCRFFQALEAARSIEKMYLNGNFEQNFSNQTVNQDGQDVQMNQKAIEALAKLLKGEKCSLQRLYLRGNS